MDEILLSLMRAHFARQLEKDRPKEQAEQEADRVMRYHVNDLPGSSFAVLARQQVESEMREFIECVERAGLRLVQTANDAGVERAV